MRLPPREVAFIHGMTSLINMGGTMLASLKLCVGPDMEPLGGGRV